VGRSRKNKNKYSKKKWGKGGMDEKTPTKSTTSASAFAVGAAEDTPELDPINVREHDGSTDVSLQQEYISALRGAQTLPVFKDVQKQKQERLDPIKKSSNKLFSSVPPTAESPPPSPAKNQGASIDERYQIPATPNPKPRPLFLPSIPSTSSDESLPGRTVRKKMIKSLFDSDSDSDNDFSPKSSISSGSNISILPRLGYFDKKPVQTYLPGDFENFKIG